MTQEEADRVRLTHFLKTAEGGTYQDTERKKPSDGHGHSHTGKCGVEVKSVWQSI